ncbi:MAG: thioredoxin family protein, partial [Planctomycetota bacterium]|nr:thioredoxin family protein [Planctomycetota bacterium]
ARPDNHMEITGHDLREALDSTLEGVPFPPDQDPSEGCNIKWKPGNEPDYFQA